MSSNKMTIKITQYGEKWRIGIEHEVWEFDDRKDFDENLKTILDIKDKKGRDVR